VELLLANQWKTDMPNMDLYSQIDIDFIIKIITLLNFRCPETEQSADMYEACCFSYHYSICDESSSL
jgi:hypothetical protein